MEEGSKHLGMPLVTHDQPAEVLQPGDGAFDFPASFVAASFRPSCVLTFCSSGWGRSIRSRVASAAFAARRCRRPGRRSVARDSAAGLARPAARRPASESTRSTCIHAATTWRVTIARDSRRRRSGLHVHSPTVDIPGGGEPGVGVSRASPKTWMRTANQQTDCQSQCNAAVARACTSWYLMRERRRETRNTPPLPLPVLHPLAQVRWPRRSCGEGGEGHGAAEVLLIDDQHVVEVEVPVPAARSRGCRSRPRPDRRSTGRSRRRDCVAPARWPMRRRS